MADGFILSILIPTIVGRETPFNLLKTKLETQLYNDGIWNEIEILTECDDRTMSIGDKRQLLLTKSRGDYVVFIDDDDDIPDDYCITLWRVLKSNPNIDSIGFLQSCTFNKGPSILASLSNVWPAWGENKGGFRFVRTPFFPTPIRRSIAVEIGYRDMRFGEDHDFARRLKDSGLIKEEYFLDKIMYYYQYTYAPHEEKYGIKK